MNELRAGIAAVLAEDPSTLTGPEMGARLVELERAMAQLMAAQLATLAVFDAGMHYADEGAANAAVWLRHRCKLTPGDASSRVRVARRLGDELEGTREALSAGDVTYHQARVIAEQGGRVADRLGEPGLVALKEAEPIFLTAARKLHPNDLGKVVRRWEHVVDADGFLTDHERQYERRFLNLSQGFGGMWHIDGLLDPESGATLHAALQPLATPAGKDDARNPGQRRLDALTDIARRVLDSGMLPQSGGEKPHLIVEVTLDTLEKRLGAPVAELAGTPIPAETARRLACDAGVTRMITGPASQPLDVGRKTRAIPPGMRRALRHRDKGCTWPGCDYPPEWTDGHHIEHWVDHHGETELENLTLLCRRHHRMVHEGRQPLPQPP